VGEEDLLDLCGKAVTASMETVELAGELGDDSSDGRLGRQRDGLGVERGHDGVGDLGRQAGRAALDRPGDPGPTSGAQRGRCRELGHQVPHTRVG
jgi:hypothetical protein